MKVVPKDKIDRSCALVGKFQIQAVDKSFIISKDCIILKKSIFEDVSPNYNSVGQILKAAEEINGKDVVLSCSYHNYGITHNFLMDYKLNFEDFYLESEHGYYDSVSVIFEFRPKLLIPEVEFNVWYDKYREAIRKSEEIEKEKIKNCETKELELYKYLHKKYGELNQ
jgi:hypothetical protein